MTEQAELKACPFCGGQAELATFRQESYGYFCSTRGVKCKSCWCKTEAFETEAYERGRGMYQIDADGPAIAAWNRRA